MTRFKEFAESPYFNKHAELRGLIGYLAKVYPHFDDKTCSKERLFREVFGKGPYEEGKLAPLLTYGRHLLEGFLACEQYQEDPFFQDLFLLRALRSQEAFRAYEKRLDQAREALHVGSEHAGDFLLKRYLLDQEALEYRNQIERHEDETFYRTKQHTLDRFFMLEKLRDACEIQVRQKILRTGVQLRFLDGILQEIDMHLDDYCQDPAIEAYYRIFRMLTEAEPGAYSKAGEVLMRFEASFSRDELIFMYNYLMNYCIGKINQGEAEFLSEVFKLYQVQLDRGLLFEDGFLSEWDYKNIVTTGIRLGHLKWVQEFIEEYKERLHPEVMENAYRFNLASCCYAMGQYDQVLDLLIRVEYSDLRYSLGAKALLLRTYYDLEEYEPLFSLAESFRQYLQRNKLLADTRRIGYYNMFKIARKAAYLRSRLDYLKREKAQAELQKIRTEMEQTQEVFNRAWLEEKLDELFAQLH